MNKSTTKSHKKPLRRRRLVPVAPRNYRIKSLTRDDDTRYSITESPQGVITCTCPAAQFHPGVLCKHARRVLELRERHQKQATPAPVATYRCVGPMEDEDGNLIPAHVETVPAPCAVRSTGPVCVSCGQMDAIHWLTTADGKDICAPCAHDSLPLTDDDFPELQDEADTQGEAEYYRSLDAAESFGSFVERVAQAEAAEAAATMTIICNVGRFCTDSQPVEAVAIKASRSIGYGSATISYWAQDAAGDWFPFLKKDNPKLKLPTSKDLTWQARRLSDVRGVRACYRQETEPMPVSAIMGGDASC